MKNKLFYVVLPILVAIIIGFACQTNQPELTPQEKTFKFLTENGFSVSQACGIMSCMEISSDFNPAAEDLNHKGYGLLFWTAQRKENLEKFADIQDKPLDDLQLQLEFLLEELDPNSQSYQLLSYNGYTPEDFWNASTPEEAALSFCCAFEHPHKNFFKHSKLDRIMLANKFYEEFSN